MDVFKRGPEEAPAGLVVMSVGVAAVAAAVAKNGPTQLLYDPAGSRRKLAGCGGSDLHFCAVNGLLQLLELVATTVGTCKRDIHD